MTRHVGLAIALSLTLAAASFADEYERDLTKPKGAGPFFQIRRGTKWGFIDVRGNPGIRPQFEDEGHFLGGLARVRIGERWEFIVQTGRMVIAPRFEAAGDFTGPLAPVRVGRRWGYINRARRMIVAPTYQGAAWFREGMARVETWSQTRCAGRGLFTKDNAPEDAFHIQTDIVPGGGSCIPLNLKVGYVDERGGLAIG